MPNPGRIRTLRLDHNVEPSAWLTAQWARDENGRRGSLLAVNLVQDKIDRGCTFLAEDYQRSKSKTLAARGYEIFCDWQTAFESGMTAEDLPEKYLPENVRNLRRLKKESPHSWSPPPLTENDNA